MGLGYHHFSPLPVPPQTILHPINTSWKPLHRLLIKLEIKPKPLRVARSHQGSTPGDATVSKASYPTSLSSTLLQPHQLFLCTPQIAHLSVQNVLSQMTGRGQRTLFMRRWI